MTAASKSPYRQSSRNRIRLGLATGIASLFLAFALVLALSASPPALAATAGSFANALKDRFCVGTSGASLYGCFGYMHYRVDSVKSKDAAKDSCHITGCTSRYKIGTNDWKSCITGCDQAYAADTN